MSSEAVAAEALTALPTPHDLFEAPPQADPHRDVSQNPFASPNAIPPRTSSTGLANRASLLGRSQSQRRSRSQDHRGPPHGQSLSFAQSAPLPAVLRPVSEADWLSPKRQTNNWYLPAAGSSRPSAQHQHLRHPSLLQQHQQHRLTGSMTSPPPPPPNPDRYVQDDLTSPRSWTDVKEGVIRAPFDYALTHPSKDFRTQLIAAFNAWLDVPRESLEIITKVIGILHESSLLIDDVQDSSELRRGFPVAHNIFGVPQTINAANYMCYVALQELLRLNNPRALSIYAEELVNLHRGQGMELFWRDTLTCPTEDDYLEMVGNKTGGLFRLGIKLMQAESLATIDCVALVNLIGVLYQIRDDYLNLSSDKYTEHKGMCEDLTEGKFSFPVIHSIRTQPGNLQLISILKQKTTDTQVKRYAVSYMDSTGSFAYTRAVISTLIERARSVVTQIDAGQGKADGMMKIIDRMIVE